LNFFNRRKQPVEVLLDFGLSFAVANPVLHFLIEVLLGFKSVLGPSTSSPIRKTVDLAIGQQEIGKIQWQLPLQIPFAEPNQRPSFVSPSWSKKCTHWYHPNGTYIEISGVSPSTRSAGTRPFNTGVSCAVSLRVPAYHSPQKHHVLFGDPSDCMNLRIPRLIARLVELSALFFHVL
jgi:hypothetical protein